MSQATAYPKGQALLLPPTGQVAPADTSKAHAPPQFGDLQPDDSGRAQAQSLFQGGQTRGARSRFEGPGVRAKSKDPYPPPPPSPEQRHHVLGRLPRALRPLDWVCPHASLLGSCFSPEKPGPLRPCSLLSSIHVDNSGSQSKAHRDACSYQSSRATRSIPCRSEYHLSPPSFCVVRIFQIF